MVSWRNVHVSPAGTQVDCGFRVVSRQVTYRWSEPIFVDPQIVIHRKLIWGNSEVLMRQMREIYPGVLLSYHVHWKYIGQKWNTERCFQAAEERSVAVPRPPTYLVTPGLRDILAEAGRVRPLIFKPVTGSQCEGIFLSTPRNIQATIQKVLAAANVQYIAQELITEIPLYEGRKFDLRIYAMMLSGKPLRYRLYKEGVARVAAEEYRTDDPADPLRALTGSSFRKRQGAAARDLTVSELLEYLEARGHAAHGLWCKIDSLVSKVFRCIADEAISLGEDLNRCFYFAGIDVLVVNSQGQLDVAFLEINYVPQLTHWTNEVDKALESIYSQWLADLKQEIVEV